VCPQELQERLAHSEAAAAAFGREHCDAVWLKGQYDGLKGLNEFLQEQLAEQSELLRLQAEEVQELRTQLERCAGTGRVNAGLRLCCMVHDRAVLVLFFWLDM
jgi:hypothetical protein